MPLSTGIYSVKLVANAPNVTDKQGNSHLCDECHTSLVAKLVEQDIWPKVSVEYGHGKSFGSAVTLDIWYVQYCVFVLCLSFAFNVNYFVMSDLEM